jgi:hypothetical protein
VILLVIFPLLLGAVISGCAVSFTAPTKLAVKLIQRHETNHFGDTSDLYAYGGPCHSFEGESNDFVGVGFAIDTPELTVHTVDDYFEGGVPSAKVVASKNGSSGGHLTAFVTCMTPIVPIDVRLGSPAEVTVESGATGAVESVCRFGTPVGGHYVFQKGTGYVETFQHGEHAWIVKAHAVGGPLLLSVTASCENRRLTPIADQPSNSVLVPAGGSARVSVTCPSGSTLTNGGFDVPDGRGVIVTQSSPAEVGDPSPGPVTNWRVSGVNIDRVDHLLYARAVCMTVDAADHPTATFVPPALTVTPLPTTIATPLSTPTPLTPHLSIKSIETNAFCLNGQYPSITVKNIGGGTLTWSATTGDANNVALRPAIGSLGPGAVQSIHISGSHPGATLTVFFTSNGGAKSIVFICR